MYIISWYNYFSNDINYTFRSEKNLDVLDAIWDVIESVSEEFLTYFSSNWKKILKDRPAIVNFPT